MSESPLWTTPEQKHNVEQRRINDAALLLGGAGINADGRLEVTLDLWHQLYEPERWRAERHGWLNTAIPNAWKKAFPERSQSVRVVNGLARGGLWTVRDIMVAGRSRVKSIRNFGTQTMTEVESMISNEYDVAWQAEPTVRDIAKLCRSLDEVNLVVIGLIGSVSDSVQGFLDADEKARQKLIPGRHSLDYERNPQEAKFDYLEAAQKFADEFHAITAAETS